MADWLLYEHDDGRHAVAPSAEAATFARNDPAWHRVGPVDVPQAAVEALETALDVGTASTRPHIRAALSALTVCRAALEAQPQPQPIAWVAQHDLERLRADKWSVAEVTAYEQNPPGTPLYAAPAAADGDAREQWEDLRAAATAVVMRAEQVRGSRPMPPEVAALERALEELAAMSKEQP